MCLRTYRKRGRLEKARGSWTKARDLRFKIGNTDEAAKVQRHIGGLPR
jgi:hypothetical protein